MRTTKEINAVLQEVMLNPGRTYSLVGKWLSNRCGEEKYPPDRLYDFLDTCRGQGIRAPVGFFMYHIGKDITIWREEVAKKQKTNGGVIGGILKR